MSDLSTPEVVMMGFVTALVIKEAFAMVRANRQKNGHSSPERARVSKEDAPEFYLMQLEMLNILRELKARHHRVD